MRALNEFKMLYEIEALKSSCSSENDQRQLDELRTACSSNLSRSVRDAILGVSKPARKDSKIKMTLSKNLNFSQLKAIENVFLYDLSIIQVL